MDYPPQETVYCLKCGILIGEVVHTPAGSRLKIGNVEAEVIHGKCHNPTCGAHFHWSAGDSIPPFVARRYKPKL